MARFYPLKVVTYYACRGKGLISSSPSSPKREKTRKDGCVVLCGQFLKTDSAPASLSLLGHELRGLLDSGCARSIFAPEILKISNSHHIVVMMNREKTTCTATCNMVVL